MEGWHGGILLIKNVFILKKKTLTEKVQLRRLKNEPCNVTEIILRFLQRKLIYLRFMFWVDILLNIFFEFSTNLYLTNFLYSERKRAVQYIFPCNRLSI